MKPTLVVLAAGMGSRYGGLKQVDPVGPSGEALLDYSVFDAIRGGFGKIVFVIRKDIDEAFRKQVGSKYEGRVAVEYCYQDINDLPPPFAVPAERTKPWGTGHALLCCRDVVGDDNFSVINADDFYGKTAYELAAAHLSKAKEKDYCMIGYLVKNTVTEQGGVSRGVCEVENGIMKKVVETHEITLGENCIYYPTPDGNVTLDPETIVSMNFFCFTPDFFKVLEEGFHVFLKENQGNLMKCEYYIPLAVQMAIDNGYTMKVVSSPDKWFGVTYITDKPGVIAGIKGLTDAGLYPNKLW